MTFLYLILEFFKTGLFAIGGGMATIPFLYEIAEKYPWFTTAQLIDMIAISESTPGPVGVNMATFAGYMAEGIWGGLAATLSLVLPSYIIILIIARMLNKFQGSVIVGRSFDGLRPAVAGLLSAATLEIFKVALFTDVGTTVMTWLKAIDIKASIVFVAIFLFVSFSHNPLRFVVTTFNNITFYSSCLLLTKDSASLSKI